MSTITLALVGAGERGQNCYAPHVLRNGQGMHFTAVAEPDEHRRNEFVAHYGVPSQNVFKTADELFAAPRIADAVLICTQDKQHYEHARAAILKGYTVLLEKPISPSPQECISLQKLATKHGVTIVVCHVLRYTNIFKTIKKLLDDGAIGDIVSIVHTENIGYWHYAHSYVRGNWKSSADSSPMILAKCCHDLDILSWLIGSRCKSVSSFGDLRYFTKDNAPEGAPSRCLEGCPKSSTCPYYAPKMYMTGAKDWPASCLGPDLSEEGRRRALMEGPYGKCVFSGENDVVDHQVASLLFENGVSVSFTASAFSNACERTMKIMGTTGEINVSTANNQVTLTEFGPGMRTGNTNTIKIVKSPYGHNGGDEGIMENFAGVIRGFVPNENLFEQSVHSHIIAFAAEEARLTGEVVNLSEFEKTILGD